MRYKLLEIVTRHYAKRYGFQEMRTPLLDHRDLPDAVVGEIILRPSLFPGMVQAIATQNTYSIGKCFQIGPILTHGPSQLQQSSSMCFLHVGHLDTPKWDRYRILELEQIAGGLVEAFGISPPKVLTTTDALSTLGAPPLPTFHFEVVLDVDSCDVLV